MQNSQENTRIGVPFSIKLHDSSLQLYWKRDSYTDVFLWVLRNFKKQLFTGTSTFYSLCNKSYLHRNTITEAADHSCSRVRLLRKMLQNPQENVCDGVLFFNKFACEIELFYNFTKRVLSQVFLSEFCKIFQTNFFQEHFGMTASALNIQAWWPGNVMKIYTLTF